MKQDEVQPDRLGFTRRARDTSSPSLIRGVSSIRGTTTSRWSALPHATRATLRCGSVIRLTPPLAKPVVSGGGAFAGSGRRAYGRWRREPACSISRAQTGASWRPRGDHGRAVRAGCGAILAPEGFARAVPCRTPRWRAHGDIRKAIALASVARASWFVTLRRLRRIPHSKKAALAAHASIHARERGHNEAWFCQHAAIGTPESDDCARA